MTDDARTYDFLEGGGTLEYHPQAPDLTPAQKDALERVRAYQGQYLVDTAAAQTSGDNAKAYWAERAKSDQDSLAVNHAWNVWQAAHYPSGAWNFASLDLGLLPAAVVVIRDLVVLAASGGLAAPAVALDYKNLKKSVQSVKSAADVKRIVDTGVKAAEAVQERVDRTAKVFKVDVDLGLDDVAAAGAVADRILGDVTIPNALDILANTRDLAFTGDVDAQRGMVILAKVAGARIDAGVQPGQPLIPPKTPEQAASIAATIPRVVKDLTDSEAHSIVGFIPTWWDRLVNWFHNI